MERRLIREFVGELLGLIVLRECREAFLGVDVSESEDLALGSTGSKVNTQRKLRDVRDVHFVVIVGSFGVNAKVLK